MIRPFCARRCADGIKTSCRAFKKSAFNIIFCPNLLIFFAGQDGLSCPSHFRRKVPKSGQIYKGGNNSYEKLEKVPRADPGDGYGVLHDDDRQRRPCRHAV
ncbi:MAG: hypothetical protein HFF25_03845 [Oscillospiraceae bacterium]|nr:hypothetical protein [Oscillospiraceae bacterium]MCI9550666.1 hypothetical protein [Oscillospiraceae bacterium]